MAAVRANDAVIFCDPGPCDPWKLDLFARGYDWWVLLLIIVTSAIRRSNWKLSLASMSLIAVAIHLQVNSTMNLQRLHFIHLAGPGNGLTAQDRRGLDELWSHETDLAVIGYAGFAIVPFLIGVALSAIRRRRSSTTSRLIGKVA